LLNVFIVGLGGFIGSALRYLIGGWAQGLSKSLDFPYGTLTVNLIGCFVIGLLGELAEARGIFTSETRLLCLSDCWAGLQLSRPLAMTPSTWRAADRCSTR